VRIPLGPARGVMACGVLLFGGALLPWAAPLEGQARALEEVRPQAPATAASIRFPAGALLDPQGAEGSAFLLGRVLQAEADRRLGRLSGRALVEVALETTTVTVLVPTASWAEAWSELRDLLGSAPLDPAVVAEARDRLTDELGFQAGAPVRAFEGAWQAFRLEGLVPAGTSPTRPLQGTSSSVAGLSVESLQDFRTRALRWDEAVVAVVGGAGASDAPLLPGLSPERVALLPADTVRAPAPTAPAPAGADSAVAPTVNPGPPLPPAARRIAWPAPRLALPEASGTAGAGWSTGARRVIDQDITSTWIGVAWAVPEGTPWVLVDFLAHVISEALNPSPPDPGLYRAGVEIQSVGDARLLVVTATVDPQAATAWETRILGALEGLTEAPLPGAFFDLARRRYRASRLLEFADPALRARWIVARGAGNARVPAVLPESWALSREALADLAGRLREPRVLLYGPERMMALPGA
jgi:hypothetical protein